MSNLIVVASTVKRTNPATGLVESTTAVLIPTKNPAIFAVKVQEESSFAVTSGGFVATPKSALLKFNADQHPALRGLAAGQVLGNMKIHTQYSVGKPFYVGQKPMQKGANGAYMTVGGIQVFMQRTPTTDLTAVDDARPVYDTVAQPVANPAATLSV